MTHRAADAGTERDVDVDVVASGGSTHHGADALRRTATAADDPAEIARPDSHFQAHLAAAFAGIDTHGFRIVDDGTHDVHEHGGSSGRQCGARLGIGHDITLDITHGRRAGLLRGASGTELGPRARDLEQLLHTIWMNRPSRGDRLSAATMRYCGCLVLPTRVRRSFTAMRLQCSLRKR